MLNSVVSKFAFRLYIYLTHQMDVHYIHHLYVANKTKIRAKILMDTLPFTLCYCVKMSLPEANLIECCQFANYII